MKPDGKILPICMTIAGSDSGGGAGIQADLKTFASLKCYGVSVITAITAQNTKSVTDIHIIPKNMIKKQIIAIKKDMNFKAVKTGMLPDENAVNTVSDDVSSKSCSGFGEKHVSASASKTTFFGNDRIPNTQLSVLLVTPVPGPIKTTFFRSSVRIEL